MRSSLNGSEASGTVWAWIEAEWLYIRTVITYSDAKGELVA
jgi:hypothetical protein